MPNRSNEYLSHWRPAGRLEARLAELMAVAEERLEHSVEAYFQRVDAILQPEERERLYAAWEAGQAAPVDIHEKLQADEQVMALRREWGPLDWALHAARRGTIISEHYWFKELGRVKPPKGWGLG